MGPCIATVDELQYPLMQIQSRVNGELRRDSNAGCLYLILTILSVNCPQGMTLREPEQHHYHRNTGRGGHGIQPLDS